MNSSSVRPAPARVRSAELAALKQSSSAPALGRGISMRAFRANVWKYWRTNGRHALPWRKTKDPYRILISEVMLQQTQVPRVIEKYKEFLHTFPTVRHLARAPLSDVLKVWIGMGYNRRAKFLRDAAFKIVSMHKGKVPTEYKALRALPGVGDYTARAVRVFAFGESDVLVETNIRATFIHHFFPDRDGISDAELLRAAQSAARDQSPREWHWALMDYGASLKKLHQNPTRRSAHFVAQTKFEGSLRQVRGAILKLLNENPYGDLALSKKLSYDGVQVRQALHGLKKDGLVTSEKGMWRTA